MKWSSIISLNLFILVLSLLGCHGQASSSPQCPSPPEIHKEVEDLLLPSCSEISTPLCPPGMSQQQCDQEKDRIDNIVTRIIGCLQNIRQTATYDMSTEFMSIVSKITETLMAEKDVDEMLYMANRLKEHPKMNYRLWLRAMLNVIDQRQEDFEGYQFRQSLQAMPHFFLSTKSIDSLKSARDETCTFVDESEGKANAMENLLFYFREDIGVNSHHAYWHAVHAYKKPNNVDCPISGSVIGEQSACHEDRRGELFYYMHRVMLAKYHTERLSHCLPPLLPFKLQTGGVIDSGYVPHLHIRPENNLKWDDRPKNIPLPDETMEQNTSSDNKTCTREFTNVRDLLRKILNIETAILNQTYVSNNGINLPLTMDILGNILEASGKNPNQDLYGSVHNSGHDLISKALYPKQLNASVGVMGDTATAMRDPIFYRWHLFIDDLFDSFQRSLPPHEVDSGDYPLLWDEVHVKDLWVNQIESPFNKNELNTFWTQQIYQLVVPKNGQSCGKSKLCFKHLDHKDFEYNIRIVNPGDTPLKGTIRIFLAPRHREDGMRLTMLEQRKYMHTLDTFNMKEILPGDRTYVHPSLASSLTTARSSGGSLNGTKVVKDCGDNSCGCGWPHHLLLPKGQEGDGMEFDLIVMITNGTRYRFLYNQEDEKLKGCQMAPLVCGITGLNRPYPDIDLPMGYPFDRLPYLVPRKKNLPRSRQRKYVEYMDNYADELSNMHRTTIKIIHNNFFLENANNPLRLGRQLPSTAMPKSYCRNRRGGEDSITQRPSTTTRRSTTTPWSKYSTTTSRYYYGATATYPPTTYQPHTWTVPYQQPYNYNCNCYGCVCPG